VGWRRTQPAVKPFNLPCADMHDGMKGGHRRAQLLGVVLTNRVLLTQRYDGLRGRYGWRAGGAPQSNASSHRRRCWLPQASLLLISQWIQRRTVAGDLGDSGGDSWAAADIGRDLQEL
jgi:hypothetical protein